ncbi:hypothetical protein B0A48_00264 [Cryoendolithus antarcticus]|uniref:Major facilitator superfamily (MFS) profile domain-containing protein n=1 Tax=Cryoendolithus antarcticus TaxID=1507870 RepID=A0A1V8TUL6_9PEZI|nr:hypothetical protein B0A48_00264 [Cryoendolithus antarcticus]
MAASEKDAEFHIENTNIHGNADDAPPYSEDDHMTLQAYLALAAISSHWNVAASVMVTVGGRLSDIFGRRYFMVAGACIALIGAVVGATGQSINQMIASGVLFGIGGGLQEMCFAAVQEVVPMRYRVFAIGCFELTALIAFVSPVIAYAMLSQTIIGWRAVYWFLFSFEACGLTLLVFCYKPPTFHTKHRTDGKTRIELLRQMDFVRVLLFASGCISFLLGINWGGRKYAWSSAPVISTIVIGAVLLVSLGLWEAFANLKYPMLPPKSGLLFVPAGKPIIAGVYANMVSYGTILAGLVVVFFCQRVGHERWQQVGFMVVQTALIGSLASVGLDDRIQAVVTIIVLATTITPPQLLAFVMISMNIDDQVDIGVANGLASTFLLMGGAVATAIYSAILSNRFASELPKMMAFVIAANNISASSAAGLLKSAAVNTAAAYKSALSLPGVTATVIGSTQRAVKLACVDAFKMVYLIALAFGGVAIICAAFTKSIPKERKTLRRAVKMENETKVQDLETKA